MFAIGRKMAEGGSDADSSASFDALNDIARQVSDMSVSLCCAKELFDLRRQISLARVRRATWRDKRDIAVCN
ncbi:MAG: hypothetical protein H6964_09540 [Chromatiaceae bacterium]|nr:hypothetical protein [Chromatiaceae bacterium]MCP5447226.1 hypothetical protein [Chromatiaceae bacterium]